MTIISQSTVVTFVSNLSNNLEFWKLLAGLGLFLFAMSQIELALKALAGPSFRSLLQKATNRPLKSILIGTLTTAVMQSSSLVSLLVLAFVGAGIMALENGIGVVIGANLGTTATGWLVATLGFKLNLTNFVLPLVAVGSLLYVFTRHRLSSAGLFIVALAFLLMGLDLMKDSVATLSQSFDINLLAHASLWKFLLAATVLAGVVQSSSAVMLITLTALHAGIIELPAAAAMAIGADLGTTSTVFIGAIKGNAAKKRVAAAHITFNLTNDLIAFALLSPMLALLLNIGLSDPLLTLVAFHSLFNLIGVIIFSPIIPWFAAFLGRRFKSEAHHVSLYVYQATSTVSVASLSALTNESAHLIARVLLQNLKVFQPALNKPKGRLPVPFDGKIDDMDSAFVSLYDRTKRLEGEIVSFAVKIQHRSLGSAQALQLTYLLDATRHAVHSSKSLRDIGHDLIEFRNSTNQTMAGYIGQFRNTMERVYADLFQIKTNASFDVSREKIEQLISLSHELHDEVYRKVFTDITEANVEKHEISSLLNVNREILNSNLELSHALNDFYASSAMNTDDPNSYQSRIETELP